jgi:hypothetical protein
VDLRLLEDHIRGARTTRGLLSALLHAKRPVAFLVGSALSMSAGGRGVPGVVGVIQLVEDEIRRRIPDELDDFRATLADATDAERYATAMRFLQDSIDQDAVNEVVRRAVRKARTSSAVETERLDDQLETRLDGWDISPGTESLAKLVVAFPDRFPGPVLTTNFDPLVGVAIRRAGGELALTALDHDGRWGTTRVDPGVGRRVEVVHLHGYWQGSETLHTPLQLQADRPHLRAELQNLLRNHLVAVMGYGGWDDAFTRALASLVDDRYASVEVVWAFYEEEPERIARRYGQLLERLNPIAMRGRFRIYRGIDCHEVLPMLLATASTAPVANPTVPPVAGGPASSRRLTADQQTIVRSASTRLGALIAKVEAAHGSGPFFAAERVAALKTSIILDTTEVLDSLEAVDAETWPDTSWAASVSTARGAAADALRQLIEAAAAVRSAGIVEKRQRALRRALVRLYKLVEECPTAGHA